MTNKLAGLFQQNAGKGFMNLIKNEDDDSETLYVYDAIGGWYGVTLSDFARQLEQVTSPTLHLRINSPGGDVFDGKAMATLLREHDAKVVAHIDGLAASAATGLVNAADERIITQGGFFMIHNAWTVQVGDRNDMMDTAALLEQIDNEIVTDYCSCSGQDESDIKQWMDDETWFNAEDSLAKGFVDSISGSDGSSTDNSAPKVVFDLSAYQNAPKIEEPAVSNADELRAKAERRLRLVEGLAA